LRHLDGLLVNAGDTTKLLKDGREVYWL
jgi:hypothetical protein